MLPDRRTSKSVKRSRRSHHALQPVNLSRCPQCNQARRPHCVCPNCGYYNSRVSVKIETKES
ncbi:MAG: 50S ribosomal protein L32 [Phycisphaerae bacterium]